jgi:hypothetical protein
MAVRRLPAPSARTLPDAGALKDGLAPKKPLDFRIYFAIINSALAVNPRTSNQNATGETVAFCHLGVATLCRFLGGLGDLGWKWVDIGGRGGVGAGCARGASPDRQYRAQSPTSRVIGKKGLTADERGFSRIGTTDKHR